MTRQQLILVERQSRKPEHDSYSSHRSLLHSELAICGVSAAPSRRAQAVDAKFDAWTTGVCHAPAAALERVTSPDAA